jgi:hypothetical protein
MTRRLIMLIVVTGLLLAGGCTSRIIREGTEFGGKGSYLTVSALSARSSTPFADYTRFQLEPLTDESGGATPREVFTLVSSYFREERAATRLPDREGKTMIIRGAIWYYEKAGLFGQLFGPQEEAIARVQFIDAESQRVLVEANIVGRTKTTRNQSPGEKARGLARGIVKVIDDRFPEATKTSAPAE